MFLVDMRQPGMTVQQIRLVRGAADFCQEFLDDVIVPSEDVLGAVGEGWTVARTQLNAERAGMARGWHMGLHLAEAREGLEPSPVYAKLARSLATSQDSHTRQLIGEAYVVDAVLDLTGKRIAQGIRCGVMPDSAGAVGSLLSARTAIRKTALMSALAGPEGVAYSEGEPDTSIGMDRVVTHRIGGGKLEMQLNLVSERHLGLPREPAVDRDIPFNQLRKG